MPVKVPIEISVDSLDAVMRSMNKFMSDIKTQTENVKKPIEESRLSFKNLGDEIKGSFTNAVRGGVMAYAGFEVVNKITTFLKDAHAEAQKQRTAITLLTMQLGYYSEALSEQAEAMEKKLFVDKTDILAAQQRLLVYTREEESIKKLIPGIVDLAKLKGISLTEAANAVGIALKKNSEVAEGQTITIRNLGVSFKNTGTEMGNVEEIQKELTKAVGGGAQAVAESLDGWSKLGFWMKQFNEELGKQIFGLSKAEDELNKYNEMKKLVTEGGYISEDTGFIKATKKTLDEAQKIVKDYEDKQATAKKNAADKSANEEKARLAELNKEKEKENEKLWQDTLSKVRSNQQAIADATQNELKKEYDDKTKEIDNYNKILEEKNAASAQRIKREEQREAVREKNEQKLKDKYLKTNIDKIKDSYEDERKMAGQNKDLIININEAEAEEIRRIHVEEQRATATAYLSTAGNVLNSLQLIGDASNANAQTMKRLAQGQALVSGALAAVRALENPIPVLKWVDFAAVIAASASQVAIIEQQKFAYGGIVTGGEPGRDSVPALLMPGEIVYNPANPNPALAAMVTNSTQTQNYATTTHIGGTTIIVQGSPSKRDLSALQEVSEKALINALRKAQVKGKITATGLTVRA